MKRKIKLKISQLNRLNKMVFNANKKYNFSTIEEGFYKNGEFVFNNARLENRSVVLQHKKISFTSKNAEDAMSVLNQEIKNKLNCLRYIKNIQEEKINNSTQESFQLDWNEFTDGVDKTLAGDNPKLK